MKQFALLPVAVLVCLSSALDAQSDQYVEGYYISQQQDTVRGYILNRSKVSQSNSFYFKSSLEQSELKQFTPDQVREYHYQPNFHFQALKVSRNGKEELKFLQKLVVGFAELYQDNNVGTQIYVLTMASGEVVQLEKQDSVIGGHLKVDKKYLGQMLYLFQDCEQLVRNTQRVEFTQNILARFVYHYNKCAHPEQQTKLLINTLKLSIRWGAKAGASLLKANVNDANVGYFGQDAEGSGWQTGLLVNLAFSRKIAFRTGVVYHDYSFGFDKKFTFATIYNTYNFQSLEIPITLKYQLSNGKIGPYFYGGINLPIHLRKTLSFERIEAGTITNQGEEKVDINHLFLGTIGLGLAIELPNSMQLSTNLGYDFRDVPTSRNRNFQLHTFTLGVEILF